MLISMLIAIDITGSFSNQFFAVGSLLLYNNGIYIMRYYTDNLYGYLFYYRRERQSLSRAVLNTAFALWKNHESLIRSMFGEFVT